MSRLFRVLLTLVVVAGLLWPVSGYAQEAGTPWWQQVWRSFLPTEQPAGISAQSYIVVDAHSGQVLLSEQAHVARYPASLTKLMTALLIVENNQDLEQPVPISESAASMEPSKMYLYADEVITVRNLLKGLLINSANDAAVALAEWQAGSVRDFVQLMNQKAIALGLEDTRFFNPMGFDDVRQVSSAYDISMLSYYVMQQPALREIVGEGAQTVYSVDQAQRHSLRPTNQLIGRDDVLGIKTGTTDLAGETLALYVERENRPIIMVLMKSEDRFNDALKLADWTYANVEWRTVEWQAPKLDLSRWWLGELRFAEGQRYTVDWGGR